MALPTKSDLLTGQFSADGSPFVQVSAKAGIDTNTLEYSADGSPFWAVPETGGGASYTLTAAAGAFTLTGIAAAIIKGVLVAATAATFTLSGQAANLKKDIRCLVPPGRSPYPGNLPGYRTAKA